MFWFLGFFICWLITVHRFFQKLTVKKMATGSRSSCLASIVDCFYGFQMRSFDSLLSACLCIQANRFAEFGVDVTLIQMRFLALVCLVRVSSLLSFVLEAQGRFVDWRGVQCADWSLTCGFRAYRSDWTILESRLALIAALGSVMAF